MTRSWARSPCFRSLQTARRWIKVPSSPRLPTASDTSTAHVVYSFSSLRTSLAVVSHIAASGASRRSQGQEKYRKKQYTTVQSPTNHQLLTKSASKNSSRRLELRPERRNTQDMEALCEPETFSLP